MIRRQYHGDIESDLKDRLIPDAIEEALREKEFTPASPGPDPERPGRIGQPLTSSPRWSSVRDSR